MSSNFKEVPSWDVPEFTNPGPRESSESDAPNEVATKDTDTTFDAIERALRDVEYQLGKSESAPDPLEHFSRAQTPDIDAVTREYTQSFTELAQRIDALEKGGETESLRDEIRGLRQRLVEDKDQFNRALDESVGKISALSSAIDNLTANLTSLHGESEQLGRTFGDQLRDLNKKLEFASAHSDNTDGQSWEAAEGRNALIEQNMENLAARFEQAELGRDKKDYAVKQALTTLLDKLSADKQQNQTALAEARDSFASELGEMRRALDASKDIIWERLESRLSAVEARYEESEPRLGNAAPDLTAFENEIEQQFESVQDQFNAEKQKNADALAEMREALASSVGELKQSLDATEKRVEQSLETRLLSIDASLEDITRRIEQSEGPSNEDHESFQDVIRSMDRRLEQIAQERDASGLRMEEAAEEMTRRLEQMERDNAAAQPLNVIVSDINRRLEKMEQAEIEDGGALQENMESMSRRLEQMERERNTNVQSINAIVGEIGRRLERVEQGGAGSGDALGEIVEGLSRRLERIEQAGNASIQPLNVMVGDISRRLEKMETDNASKFSSFEKSIADLREEPATESKQTQDTLRYVRDEHDEPIGGHRGSAPFEQIPAEKLAFEHRPQIQGADLRPVADIIQELTASQSTVDPQIGAEDLEPELPAMAEQEGASTEDLAPIVPPSFVMPAIDPAAIQNPSMGELIAGEAVSEAPVPEEQSRDGQDLFIESADHFLDAGMVLTSMADAVNLGDVPQASMKPSADKGAGIKETLVSFVQIGTQKIRAAAKLASVKQYGLAAAGAAILLLAGTGIVLFSRGLNPEAGAGIAELDPAIATGESLATNEVPGGDATANPLALPVVEVQGPAISELNPAALRANAPDAPAMFETLVTQANAGDSSSALLLGLMYLNGNGVEANPNIAFWWLRLAAEQGEPIAQNSLGSLFERGQGVEADAAEAAYWYAQAAERGNVVAMHNLALAHTDGAGVEVDLAEAARLFEDAANFGLADSQFNLAVLYSRGMGVPVALGEAYKWYLIAAEQGDPEAGTQAEALAGQLTQVEREAAAAEAAAFVPRPRTESANALPDLAQIR